MLIAVANHRMVRKGFSFADGGMELPLSWVSMLITQILLGDGVSVASHRSRRSGIG